jgi:valyl-tRNA synthetase
MSKSLGNGVDPIEVIETYGADALRFNIITGNSPGNDMRFYAERCEAMRNFANKIWNASRFVMMNLTIDKNELPGKLELEDKWILSKLNTLIREVNENMDKFEMGIAASKIYDFIWDSYCDWYIELTKPRLNGDNEAEKLCAQKVLLYVLVETLKLLHPFMPFITEEIWHALPHQGEALMVEKYPEYSDKLAFPADEAGFEIIMAAVRAIRARRAEMNVPPSKKPHLVIITDKTEVFEAGRVYLSKLAYAGDLTVSAETPASTEGMVAVVTNDAKLYMPLAELVDLRKERERIEKELKKAQEDLQKTEAKLRNESFIAKAPASVVASERERVEKTKALIWNLQESLKALN